MGGLIGLLGGVRAAAWAAGALALAICCGVLAIALSSARADLVAAKLELAELRADIAEQAAEFERKAREQEQQYVEDFKLYAEEFRVGRRDANAQIDRLLGGLRDGTERLRGRFQCPPAAGVPQAAAGTGGGGGAEGAGLRREDAEFLVREAGRADDVVRQLTACQALLRVEREQTRGAQ